MPHIYLNEVIDIMENFFKIINLISKKLDDEGFKGILPILLIVMTFFIGISPTLSFLFLYKKELLIKYHIILVSTLILCVSFLLFALIFCLTLIFSAIILQKRIEYKNDSNPREEYNFLCVTNTILTLFILSLFSAVLAFHYYCTNKNMYPDNFNSVITIILLILLFYIIVSLVANMIWFISNK